MPFILFCKENLMGLGFILVFKALSLHMNVMIRTNSCAKKDPPLCSVLWPHIAHEV